MTVKHLVIYVADILPIHNGEILTESALLLFKMYNFIFIKLQQYKKKFFLLKITILSIIKLLFYSSKMLTF